MLAYHITLIVMELVHRMRGNASCLGYTRHGSVNCRQGMAHHAGSTLDRPREALTNSLWPVSSTGRRP